MIFNLLDGDLDESEDRPGTVTVRHGWADSSERNCSGASLYETPAGEKLWPYHWRSGARSSSSSWPAVRPCAPPAASASWRPATLCTFPRESRERISCETTPTEPFRVLIGSTKSPLNVAGYPDSGKILIDMPGRRRMLPDGPELDYWEGET